MAHCRALLRFKDEPPCLALIAGFSGRPPFCGTRRRPMDFSSPSMNSGFPSGRFFAGNVSQSRHCFRRKLRSRVDGDSGDEQPAPFDRPPTSTRRWLPYSQLKPQSHRVLARESREQASGGPAQPTSIQSSNSMRRNRYVLSTASFINSFISSSLRPAIGEYRTRRRRSRRLTAHSVCRRPAAPSADNRSGRGRRHMLRGQCESSQCR